MTSTWKEPFLKIRDELTALHHGGIRLFHRVVLSTIEDPLQHIQVERNITVELEDVPLRHQLKMPNAEFAAHLHLFYGQSSVGVSRLISAIEAAEQYIKEIPSDVIEPIVLPNTCLQSPNDLAAWMSLILMIAWKSNAVYFPAEIECMVTHEAEETFSWSSFRKPDVDPRPFLLQQKHTTGGRSEFQSKFESANIVFPEIIFGYLERDVIESSIAAIDFMAFILSVDDSKSADARSSQRPKRNYLKSGADVWTLTSLLKDYHDPENNLDGIRDPLSQKEIGDKLHWSQAKVSRVMKKILGPNAMKKYKSCWVRGSDSVETLFNEPVVSAVEPEDWR